MSDGPSDEDKAYIDQIRLAVYEAIRENSIKVIDEGAFVEISTPNTVLALADVLALIIHAATPKSDADFDKMMVALVKHIRTQVRRMNEENFAERIGMFDFDRNRR